MADSWDSPPTEDEKAAAWDAPPTEAEMAAVMDLLSTDPTPAQRRQASNREIVAGMGPVEGAVTAFGEHARHALRQAANLVPFTSDKPSDEQLLEEAEALGQLRERFPVASGLGGFSIAGAPVVAAGGALLPAGASLGRVIGTSAALGAAQGATFADPGERLKSGGIGATIGAVVPAVAGALGRTVAGAKGARAPGPLKRAAEAAAVRSTGADRTAFKKAFGRPYSPEKIESTGRFLLDEELGLRTPATLKEGLEDILTQEGPKVGQIVKDATGKGAKVDLWGATLKAVQDPKVAGLAKNTEEAGMYSRVAGFLRDQLEKNGAKITPEQAHELRRTLDRLAQWDQATPKQLTEAWRAARGALNAEIDDAMKAAGLGDEWASVNSRFSEASRAKKLADIGAERRSGNQLLSLTDKMAAGTAIPAALATGNPAVAGAAPAYWLVNRFWNPSLARTLDALSAQTGSVASKAGASAPAVGRSAVEELLELLGRVRASPVSAAADEADRKSGGTE